MVIAVDGPSAVGKSTVSRRVAEAVRVPHLDTGSTYRAAALCAYEAGADLDDPAAIVQAVDAADIEIVDGSVFVNGVDVTGELRSDAITAASSSVATLPTVRERVVALQREWVERHGGSSVVEGRDIGTVVFPDAPLKVFLTARPEVRAVRRSGDAEASDKTQEQVAVEIAARDHTDSTREASPLKPAEDAVVVDTSDLTIEGVIARVLTLVEEAREPKLEELLGDHVPEIVALTRTLRGVVRTADAALAERVNIGWHGLAYHHPDAGYVCGVFPGADEVRLGFEHGVDLPDPEGLFTGGGAQVRYVVLSEWSESLRPALEDLVDAAVELGSR
ncbi:MAG: (d)CMP kinase [Actinomycetota bacterium]